MLDGLSSAGQDAQCVGRSLRRTEDVRLLTGRGQFIDDIVREPCLHLAFVRSTHARATLSGIATSACAASEGVIAVITGVELGVLGGATVNPLVPGLKPHSFIPLARDRIDAVGQPIAAVLAETAEAALLGAELVSVEYAPEPAHLHPDGTEADFAHELRAGDIESAFAGGRPVHVEISHSRLAAMPLEPRHCLADWDAAAEDLTVWTPVQAPHRARDELARILGLPRDKLRVIAPDVGGAFGAKASIYPEDVVVAWAARRYACAVRWRGTRGEDLLAGTHGRGARLTGDLVVGFDGTLLGLKAKLDFPLGSWMPYSAAVPAWNTARILPGPYKVPAIAITLRAGRDNGAPIGIYRGAGRPEAAMLMERLMDAAAWELGSDPIELRRRNLIDSSDFPWRTPTGAVLDSGDYHSLLDRALVIADYAGLRRAQAQRRVAGEIVGIGLALYIEPCGQGREHARVRLDRDGRIIATTGATAQGQGRETAFAQLVSDTLHAPLAQITIRHGDTAAIEDGLGALASRSTCIGGSALFLACEQLRCKLGRVAARLLRDAAERITIDAAGFSALGVRVSWQALAAECGPGECEATAVFQPENEAWSSGCCLAVVAIARETGTPTVERLICVDDVGTVINPMLAEGQLVGGMAQGLGEALMERIVYDDSGQLLTGSLMDYALPRASDIPSIEIASCATPSPLNPLGAKGIGEAGCIGVPAAIVNATLDALRPHGVKHIDMPLTGERLWRALRLAEEEKGL